ncbi:flagellar biosynthesis anti-sigma factor FlgM [Vibrio fujianensis]|uniref:flagellar biosynthesis anti-sigma factor FlgM n=1 Tax=Vibrio fujianensis TaxID=1974215 RepID=UPI000C16519E|nr:flagellar biosynthesis anti-sigma factor FlgM [Vibrio fujianensis]
MKIDKIAGGNVSHTSLQQTTTKTVDMPTRAKTPEHQVKVDTTAIEHAQKEMAALPDIDMAKVEQVRNALTNGQLSLDSKALSKALMQFYTGHE